MDSDIMVKIPKGFVEYDTRKLVKQGTSAGVTLPLRMEGVEIGKTVKVYIDGTGLVLIDLFPDKE